MPFSLDYNTVHAKITKAHYEDGILTKDQFDKLHQACWLYFESEDDRTDPQRRKEVIELVKSTGLTKTDLQNWLT